MLDLANRYAAALLAYADENGLEEIYRQALLHVVTNAPPDDPIPQPLGAFLAQVPPREVDATLFRFLDLARKRMNLLTVEIISAVPLTPLQLSRLEEKLIRMYRKQMEITTTVDPSLLGGLRIIVNNTVIDNTIKRKLQDMKESVYRGVYFKQ